MKVRSLMAVLVVLAVMCVMVQSASAGTALPGQPPIGYCVCSPCGCSIVVGYDGEGYAIWESVDSCPGAPGCYVRFSSVMLARWLSTLGPLTALPDGFGEWDDLNQWQTAGGWKISPGKASFKNKGWGKTPGSKYSISPKWVGPDGNLYSGPEDGWEDYAPTMMFVLPDLDLDTWRFTLGSETAYRRTENNVLGRVNGKEDKAEALSETLRFVWWNETANVSLLVPMSREEHGSNFDALDNTGIGVILCPMYRLFREEVHGFNTQVGFDVGYHHSEYDEEDQLDQPVGTTPWGVGDFESPDYLTAGVMAGAGKTTPVGDLSLSLGQQWVWDMHKNGMLAGSNVMDFTTAIFRWYTALSRHLHVHSDTTMSYTDDVPDEWDGTTYATSVAVGYNDTNWGVTGTVTRDWMDDNIDEWIYALSFTLQW